MVLPPLDADKMDDTNEDVDPNGSFHQNDQEQG